MRTNMEMYVCSEYIALPHLSLEFSENIATALSVKMSVKIYCKKLLCCSNEN